MDSFIKTVLIVGLGSIGRRHARIIKSIFPNINIIVLRHEQCNSEDIKDSSNKNSIVFCKK
mgnify:CR=1 FL=1